MTTLGITGGAGWASTISEPRLLREERLRASQTFGASAPSCSASSPAVGLVEFVAPDPGEHVAVALQEARVRRACPQSALNVEATQ